MASFIRIRKNFNVRVFFNRYEILQFLKIRILQQDSERTDSLRPALKRIDLGQNFLDHSTDVLQISKVNNGYLSSTMGSGVWGCNKRWCKDKVESIKNRISDENNRNNYCQQLPDAHSNSRLFVKFSTVRGVRALQSGIKQQERKYPQFLNQQNRIKASILYLRLLQLRALELKINEQIETFRDLESYHESS